MTIGHLFMVCLNVLHYNELALYSCSPRASIIMWEISVLSSLTKTIRLYCVSFHKVLIAVAVVVNFFFLLFSLRHIHLSISLSEFDEMIPKAFLFLMFVLIGR